MSTSPDPGPPARGFASGVVEHFSRRLVVGWISVPPDREPVRVTLRVGGIDVSSTYATADVLPGDRRNSRQQIRTFSFAVRGLWRFVKRSTRISVRVDGRALPIHGHGTYLSPPRNGKQSPADLRAKLRSGHVLTQFGTVELSKTLDVEWQRKVIGLYHDVRQFLHDEHGYDLFFVYGTLLGAVREGGYIGHDVDFDAAYVSRHCDGREAAQELVELGQALVRRGLVVDARRACLHVHRPEDPETRIDVFHVYFDEEGALAFPWGVAGTSTIRRSDWQGARTRRIDFPGGWGLVPTEAELLVEHLYGPDWRLPSPGFNWNLARTASAVEGHLCEDQRAIVHWDALYAHQGLGAGSSFCELVNGRSDVPDVVVDLGCGNGSDALVFAASGRSVVGLERSEVGVEQARRYAQELGLSAQARFEVCDFHDADGLFRLLAQLVPPDRPVLYYLRFLLHAVDEHVEQTLVRTITRRARSGDQLAVEFRTEQDANRPKHQRRLRPRFLAADAFRARLEAAGFVRVLEQESAGLSPYRGEDPILYRVLARRP